MSPTPHTFEPDGGLVCAVCQRPMRAEIHTANLTRTRVSLVLDHPRDMTAQEVEAAVLIALDADPEVSVTGSVVLP